ncbi:MAG TPA: hypothetical protein VID75_10180 [Acidimicrobiales bacterium]|jgi:hypothetical protein
MTTVARVLTFHLPSEQVDSLLELFDRDIAPRYCGRGGFRGLLFLEMGEGSSRSQMSVVSLWDEASVEDPDDATDRWWDDAADELGIGIARYRSRVLRDIRGGASD